MFHRFDAFKIVYGGEAWFTAVAAFEQAEKKVIQKHQRLSSS